MNKRQTLSLKDALHLALEAKGKLTFHWVGQKGIGKTSVIEKGARDSNLKLAFFDCTALTLEDIGIMDLNRAEGYAEYLFNKHWGFHLNEPLFIVLDEFTKAPKNLQAMLHGLLTHPRRIGSIPIHPDSIVVTTGNLKQEGVGDRMLGHTANRNVEIYIRNSTSTEWIDWGLDNGIHPMILAWVKQKPELFDSFLDDPEGTNEYISNPKNGDAKCVTGRSLHMASDLLHLYTNGDIPRNTLKVAIQGAIGMKGATDLDIFIDMADSLPSPQEILEDPENARVPDIAGSSTITVSSALTWVDNERKLGKWLIYMQRLPVEAQAYFVLLGKNKPKMYKIMKLHKPYQDWVFTNEHLFEQD